MNSVLLAQRWTARWPEGPPVGWLLRGAVPERWVRFHSLPGSRRYAGSVAEEDEVLRRHLVVLKELKAPEKLLVSSGRFEYPDLAAEASVANHPLARPWFTLDVGNDAPL